MFSVALLQLYLSKLITGFFFSFQTLVCIKKPADGGHHGAYPIMQPKCTTSFKPVEVVLLSMYKGKERDDHKMSTLCFLLFLLNQYTKYRG